MLEIDFNYNADQDSISDILIVKALKFIGLRVGKKLELDASPLMH